MQNVYEVCFYGGLVLAILLLVAAIVLFVVLKIPKVIGELTGSSAKKAMKEMQDGTAKPGSVARREQEKYYNMGSGKITAKDAVSSTEDRKASGNDSTELLEQKDKKEKKFEETDVLRPGINDYDNSGSDETEVLGAESGGDDEATDILRDESATTGDDGATDVLRGEDDQEGDDGATDVLRGEDDQEGDDGATDVLRSEDDQEELDATDVLHSDDDLEEDATDILREEEEGTSVLASSVSELEKKVKVIYNVVVVHSDETLETGR